MKMIKKMIKGTIEEGDSVDLKTINGVIEWIIFAFLFVPIMIVFVAIEYLIATVSLITSVIFILLGNAFNGSYERLLLLLIILGVRNE